MIQSLKSALLCVFAICLSSGAFAHALWIETTSTGEVGKSHEIKVFYGEYATGERDSVGKWYSDVKDFSLWLSVPGKSPVKLEKKEFENYYSASFTPSVKGYYVITIVHSPKDLGGKTKYEFSSNAVVNVNSSSAFDFSSIKNPLFVSFDQTAEGHEANKPFTVKAFANGQALANKSVTVFSPEGWGKEFQTNDAGEFIFEPLWSGRYVLELSNYEKQTGEHYGVAYEAAWQGATTSFEIQ